MSSSSVRTCPTCGATVELPAERLADRCAFCETALVDSASSGEAIDLVVGFDVPREQAAKRLRAWLQGHWWAPEALRGSARPENLHGVLVPFYVYDGVARSRYAAEVGVDWYRTETHTVFVNGRAQVRTRRVRETEWFDVEGSHVRTYTRQLVSGSKGLPEAEANVLEPFDLGRARAFVPVLTAGWVAELPTIAHADAEAVVAREVADRENAVIAESFLPGDHRRGVRNQTELAIERVQLALLPVWIATFRHEGRPFRLLVNGQTGETVGAVPRSKVKIALVVLAVLAVLGAGLLLVGAIGAWGSLR